MTLLESTIEVLCSAIHNMSECFIIEPTHKHTHTIIFLHGADAADKNLQKNYSKARFNMLGDLVYLA